MTVTVSLPPLWSRPRGNPGRLGLSARAFCSGGDRLSWLCVSPPEGSGVHGAGRAGGRQRRVLSEVSRSACVQGVITETGSNELGQVT